MFSELEKRSEYWDRLFEEIKEAPDIEVTARINKRIYDWVKECVDNGTIASIDDGINLALLYCWEMGVKFNVRKDKLGVETPLEFQKLLDGEYDAGAGTESG